MVFITKETTVERMDYLKFSFFNIFVNFVSNLVSNYQAGHRKIKKRIKRRIMTISCTKVGVLTKLPTNKLCNTFVPAKIYPFEVEHMIKKSPTSMVNWRQQHLITQMWVKQYSKKKHDTMIERADIIFRR